MNTSVWVYHSWLHRRILCDFVNSWKIGLAYETLDAGQIAKEIVALKADLSKICKI